MNGNSSADYVNAWRHVRRIFVNVGAPNVTWVWCVNTKFSGSPAISGLYPGDNHVDWISLDAYNRISNAWGEFSTRAGPTLDELLAIAPDKPIMVAETGCHEANEQEQAQGYSKGQWYRNALKNYLKWTMPRIKAWVYFNGNNPDGNDWRITTSPETLAAYQESIGPSYFSSNRFADIAESPIPPLLNDAQTNDTMGPFVSIVNPALDTVRIGSIVEFRALASDKTGVQKVEFSRNGVLQQTENLEPYQWFWTVPNTPGQTHTITAKAFDNEGNTAVSTIQVVAQPAAIITLTNSDATGTTSFITPENWDSGQMPEAGHDCVVPAGRTFCTPTSESQPYTFAGDALTLAGTFAFKMINVITVPDLRLTNGSIANWATGGNPAMDRLAGKITVQGNGTFDAGGPGLFMHIRASLHGSGNLNMVRSETVYLSGDASNFTGNWTNLSSNLEIIGGPTNALGSGTVTLVNSTNGLTFNSISDLLVPNAITGAGSVVKQGSNTVTLTGTNSHTGGTTITAGSLRLGVGGALTGNVTNNAMLEVLGAGSLLANSFVVGLNTLNATNLAANGATVSMGSGPVSALLLGHRNVPTTGSAPSDAWMFRRRPASPPTSASSPSVGTRTPAAPAHQSRPASCCWRRTIPSSRPMCSSASAPARPAARTA